MAVYPSGIVSFTSKANTIDIIDASHPNLIQAEIIAIETILGVAPNQSSNGSGTYVSSATAWATLNARLNNIETGVIGDVHSQYVKLSTITASGDIFIGNGVGTVTNLPIGAASTVLYSTGSALQWVSSNVLQGPQGLQGRQGTQGLQGIQGIQGLLGIQGSVGNQGIQGITGNTGIQGFTGIQGLQGVLGPQGVAGSAAAQGIQGPQGLQGSLGTSGSTGAQGTQGAQGTTGTQGANGTQGFNGSQGTTGSQGTNGVQGATGSQGVQGTQGNLGPQGVAGAVAAQGLQGIQGIQGVQGIQGLTGSAGGAGTQGIQGVQGLQGASGYGYYNVVSSTSLTVGTGFKTFTTTNSGAYIVGDRVRVINSASPTTYMEGPITSLTANTSITVNVDTTAGSGTIATWTFSLAGNVGLQGLQGTQGLQGIQGLGYAQLQGATGTQGANGAQGVQGLQGLQGSYATSYSVNSQSASANSSLSDAAGIVLMNVASANTYTILAATGFPVGATINILQAGGGQTTIQGTGVTINSTGATSTAPKLRVQNSMATAIQTSSNVWYIAGDIV